MFTRRCWRWWSPDAGDIEWEFECRRFGTTVSELGHLAAWLKERAVLEVVMESTAQYWKPVWIALEGQCRLYLAQAQSNRGPRGRKTDFRDAQRLVSRLVAGELTLSYVPESEQRGWRTLTRTKHQLREDRVRLQNQLENLLEEAPIKLSSVLSDLPGKSGRRILRALAEGESDPVRLAELGNWRLQASKEELVDALSGRPQPLHRQLLSLYRERLDLIESQMARLERSIAQALQAHQEAVGRLVEMPGIGVDSAQQIIAEIGPQAKAFPSAGQLASWVGVCPGREESAGESRSNRSAKVTGQCAGFKSVGARGGEERWLLSSNSLPALFTAHGISESHLGDCPPAAAWPHLGAPHSEREDSTMRGPSIEFHKIWIEQCAATEAIPERFGLENALSYLIGEKLFNFVDVSEQDPQLAAELPAFVAEIRRLFATEEICEYLDRLERTKFLAPQDPDLEMDDPDEEAEEESWRENPALGAQELLRFSRVR
jgi:transposase